MKWKLNKKYMIGGAVVGIIAIVAVVLIISNKAEMKPESKNQNTAETTKEGSTAFVQSDNSTVPSTKAIDAESQHETMTEETVADTEADNQNEYTSAAAQVIDFNDLLNLPGNVNTGETSNIEKTEPSTSSDNDSTTAAAEEQTTTHADPDGPGWSDWIMP